MAGLYWVVVVLAAVLVAFCDVVRLRHQLKVARVSIRLLVVLVVDLFVLGHLFAAMRLLVVDPGCVNRAMLTRLRIIGGVDLAATILLASFEWT